MSNRHVTFEAAKKIREANKHLEGSVFTGSDGCTETVESIVIAPKNALDHFSFSDFYLETRNSNALLQFYSYHDYAVVAVVQREDRKGKISYDYRPLDEYRLKNAN
jgi:hypothetical protein